MNEIDPFQRNVVFPKLVGLKNNLNGVFDQMAGNCIFQLQLLTEEPGIYIPEGSNVDPKWWNIGVRIEDNILITVDGHKNLSALVPKTVRDIERIMKEDGILPKLELAEDGMD